MLHVLCRVGGDAYAIPASAVERVIPCAALKGLPGATHGLAGLLNYQGSSVPVVDLSLALTGTPARELLSTRILLCPLEESPTGRLGLLVESVSRTVQLAESDFKPAGASGAEFLDGVAGSGAELLQRIEVPRILPDGLLVSLGLSSEWAE